MRLLILGGRGGTALGESFARAAGRLGHESDLLDTALGYGSGAVQSVLWRLADKRPARRATFERTLLDSISAHRPDLVLAAGLPPVSAGVWRQVSEARVATACFLSDDPWNAAHRSRWGIAALGHFDRIYTPRIANLGQLEALAPGRVTRMPFGFDHELFHPVAPDISLASDLLFVGTCDADRIPHFRALRASGLRTRVYGRYYDRWPETRGMSGGQVDSATLRVATCSAKINLCLVRHANRDGHVMRTFEMAACGACMLVERTAEHEHMFGDDGECVRYFSSPNELQSRVGELMADAVQREELGARVLERVGNDRNSYVARLGSMLEAFRRP